MHFLKGFEKVADDPNKAWTGQDKSNFVGGMATGGPSMAQRWKNFKSGFTNDAPQGAPANVGKMQ